MIHVQSLIDAIGVGALYALVAVGIGLVFGVLRLINFAYGQLIMLAAYALAFTDSWPDAASIAIAVLVAVAASLVLERLAFRPLRTADASTMRGASPSDGSSRRRTSGSATSARAIASCCCWPPESAPALRRRNSWTIGKSS